MILIDRKNELKFLEENYKSKKAEFIVIYGRRRLGKTHIIKYFLENKPHFYYIAKQKFIKEEFEEFKSKMGKKFNVFFEGKNFEELFKEIDKIESKSERFVIVIDEFPYWIIKNKEIVSEFQYYWDEILSKKNLMLVLLGSYMSFVENYLLSYKSPIYGRKTGQIELKQMPISSLVEFFPNKKIEEIINIYGMTDSIPYYLLMIEKEETARETLERLISPYSNFFNDAEILLREELREYNTYLEILRSINEGATKLNEIANKSRVDITNISKYLKVLLGMKIIDKVAPVTAVQKEKNFLYVLKDNYFKFYLKFIYPYKEEIEETNLDHIKFVIEKYNGYMGNIFETFCKRLIVETRPFEFLKIGRWWYKDKEIDIVALDSNAKAAHFIECKWQDDVNSEAIVRELEEKAKEVYWNNLQRKENFVVFARSFKKKIKEFNGKNVFCYDLEDIEKLMRKKISLER